MGTQNELASRRLSKMPHADHNDHVAFQVMTFREVSFMENSRAKNTKWHKHSFYEMHIVRQGQLIYQFEDGHDIVLPQGHAILIRQGIVHRLSERSDDYIKVSFSFRINAERSNQITVQIAELLQHSPYQIIHATNAMLDTCDRVFAEAMQQSFAYENMIRLCQERLLIEMARLLPPTQLNSLQESPNKLQDERIVVIREFISDNITIGITSADIADHLHISVKQLNRIVRHECGRTLFELVSDIKCNYAKIMMQDQNVPLNVIAEKLGFSSEYSFIRFFKRVEGMPPGMYRRDIND